MGNQYAGRCGCGSWVNAYDGTADAPARRCGKWIIRCYDCMTPSEQEMHQRLARDHISNLEASKRRWPDVPKTERPAPVLRCPRSDP
jgi:hypothetical protein